MAPILVIGFYIALGVGVIWLGAFLYLRSVASRKHYACPQCGERMRVELMDASRCSQCGAPLNPGQRS